VPNGKSSTPVLLKDTLYAPQIGSTIISIGRIASAGYSVSFENGSCNIQKEQNSKIIGSIPTNGNGLYKVEHVLTAGAATEQVNIHTLHRRLGHVSLDSIRKLVRNNAVAGLQIIDDPSPFFCDLCQYAKATRKAICKECSTPQASAFGDEVHTDVWGGPTTPTSLGGCKYYISFTDDYSCYTWLTLLRTKDKALEAYRAFAAWAKTQHSATIKHLHSDRGGEYTGKEFSKFLQEEGSEWCLTTHNTPQHNGISEALN
jgi:transposase InsO family protein